MEDTTKTWLTDDIFFFPDTLLGMRKPDGGFFMALENQSTDDGKVFVNALQDQDLINYAMTVIRKYELPELLAKSKTFVRGRKFRQDTQTDECEHGVVYWDIDDEKSVVMAFSTQGSDLMMDEASNWLGEAQVAGTVPVHGLGTVPNTSDEIINQLMVSPPAPAKILKAAKASTATAQTPRFKS